MAERMVDGNAVPSRAVSQLAGYLLNEAPFTDSVTLREWIETWLEAWCKRKKRGGLDPRTLRAVSRRLRSRANELDRKNKRNKALIGESPSLVRVGRANECDLQADNLLSEAKKLESPKKKAKRR